MTANTNLPFDLELAKTCSQAFSASTGIGCTVSDAQGVTLCEHGYGCASCELCGIAGKSRDKCINAHNYGMTAASRFGGRYIYFCPMGLTCFVSPIIGDTTDAAKITVGPFIMVDKQDYIDCELQENFSASPEALRQALVFLEKIPLISPEKVQELSILLFMSAGFMNHLSEESRFMTMARSDSLQKEISAYILQMKQQPSSFGYPFDMEKNLLQSLSHYDPRQTLLCLKNLLASLLTGSGGNLKWIKARLSELLVMISRTAIENGAPEGNAMLLLRRYRKASPSLDSFDSLSAWTVKLIGDFMEEYTRCAGTGHTAAINKCLQYLDVNYSRQISLESAAQQIGLTPAYLSRIFKKETGCSFNQYLNRIRITKARDLLRYSRMSLSDIAMHTGYNDQSYFTKVFQRITGMSPGNYRKKHSHMKK
ncbi:MAG: helix-turn-helix domain-containing protein [Lachnospiraceae bacterium]|nr:helix-turn-helix domain-containing protein [Lachnospiraceae bacterium]